MLWFSHKYLVEIFGTAWLFRNVVDRKHTNAREARTLVPKLKMSLARNTADLRDPEFKKSLIAFSMEVKGFPLLLLLPIVSLIWYLIWNKMSLLTLSNSLQSTFKLFSSFSLELPTLLFLYYLQYYWKKIVTRKLPLNRTLLLFQLIFSKAAHVHCRCWITVLLLLLAERESQELRTLCILHFIFQKSVLKVIKEGKVLRWCLGEGLTNEGVRSRCPLFVQQMTPRGSVRSTCTVDIMYFQYLCNYII